MNKTTTLLASLFSIIAGALHASIVAFEHVATPPLETIFFVTGGIAQVVVAVWFLRSKEFKPAAALFVINGALASVWGLTRVFRAPFMDSPEGVGMLGLSVLLLEIGSMISVAAWKWLQKHSIKEAYGYSYTAVIAGAIVLSLMFGSFVYASGKLGEVVMPNRELNHNHAHGGHGGSSGHDSEQNENHQDSKTDDHTTNGTDGIKNKKKENQQKTQKEENSDSHDDTGGHSDGHGHS